MRKIKEITKEKKIATVITLHDPNLASIFSDKIVIIKNGKVLHNGHSSEVINERILNEIYGIEVEIIKHNGINVVFSKI